MITNEEFKMLIDNPETTDNNKKGTCWYEQSEYLNNIYNTNDLDPNPDTWEKLKKWIDCVDKESVSSEELLGLIVKISLNDFMFKNNAKDFLAKKGLLSKREFETIWKRREEFVKAIVEKEEIINVYEEIEKDLRAKFDIVSYKKEILVKVDNAYTNILDVLLTCLNILAKKYKVNYRSIKGDVLESLRDSRIEDMSFFCYDSWLLNFKNGYYNFIDNKFTKAKDCIKEFVFSINRNYKNIKADCPIFKKALEGCLKGNKHIKIDDIFEFMCYSLMFGNFLKAFFLNIGDTNTGKTQIMEILKAFVPFNNRIQTALHRLTKDQFGAMGLNNIILCYYDDLSDKMIYDVSMIKSITGGASEISIEIKHGGKVDAKNTAKIWQNGNYLPKIYNSADSAFIDRAIIIEFKNQIDRYAKTHKEQFYLTITENKTEMNGIISELIKAGKRLYERGNFRKSVRDYSKKHYVYKSSEIFAFLRDFTKKVSNSSISFNTAKDIINEYRTDRKKPVYNSHEIKKELELEGFFKSQTNVDNNRNYIIKGLKWKNTEKIQTAIDKYSETND